MTDNMFVDLTTDSADNKLDYGDEQIARKENPSEPHFCHSISTNDIDDISSEQNTSTQNNSLANQMHGNPVSAYECTGCIHSRDSCNDDRQRKDNSLADASSSDDKVCSDNVVGDENQTSGLVPSTLDSQDEGNATHEGSQQKSRRMGPTLLIRCIVIL